MVEKICYIHDSDLNTSTGGSEEGTKQIIRFLKEDGKYHTTYISPYKLPNNITVDNPLDGQKTTFIKPPKNIGEQDVIIFNNPNPLSIIFLSLLPEELKSKTCAIWRTLPESFFPVSPNSIEGRISTFLFQKFQNIFGNSVNKNLAVSSAVEKSLQQAGVSSEKIINIGEQLNNKYNPNIRLNNKENYRQKYLEPDEFGILFVGRISPEKGIDWLVKLYENLRQNIRFQELNKYKKVKINVVGPDDSNYASLIKRKIKRATAKTEDVFRANSVEIEFLGKKNQAQLQEIYNVHDLFFMPSPAEGFGRVTVEALSAGLPVIGRSGCLATEEIINSSPYSIGTTIQDIERVAGEIFYLINNPNTLQDLSDQSSQWACSHYTEKRAKDRLLQAIN